MAIASRLRSTLPSRAARNTSTASVVMSRPYNAFSSPDTIQMTNDGVLASNAPTASVPSHGRRCTFDSAAWHAVRIPAHSTRASAFGKNA
ncbi:hypothetical protein [Saccharomonospora sp. CUA-673]|uniref:hypothetical protein n=1 Tax=Saccharomonospora sp. CUA-673 TaxID=1904969 RepID=UPI00111546E7|nr:hypothetical protein [Saccharomonospora sp. CUA-673]